MSQRLQLSLKNSKLLMPKSPIQAITKEEPRFAGEPTKDHQRPTTQLQTPIENPKKNVATEETSQGVYGETAPQKIGVFISYNHKDLLLANILRQCLITLSSDLVPFLDHVGLKAGDEYEEKLAKSIGDSQWFIMLCSGPHGQKDMSWSFYEAGQFRRKFLEEGRDDQVESRLFAIYDEEMPSPLAKFQGIRISSKDAYGKNLDLKADKPSEQLEEGAIALFENTDIFKSFQAIITESRKEPLRELADPNVRSVLKTNARTLISAFINHQDDRKLAEIVFQPRISFWLFPSAGQSFGPSSLKMDTLVTGDSNVLSQLFGLVGTETTWGTIKGRCSDAEGNAPAWTYEVEAAAEEVSINHEPKQPDGLHVGNDQKFYRVLFARCDPFTSGSRLCYILFVPRTSRHFDVKERTSILLSALILSIRFRQRILPFTERLQELPRKDKINGLLAMEKILLEIETESLEFGLEMPDDDLDDSPLAMAFREGENKSFVEQSTVSWLASRQVLAGVFKDVKITDPTVDRIQVGVDGAEKVVNELKRYPELNGKFIQVLTEELLFLERVRAGQ